MQAGVKSRSFQISRGVKQGDPISSVLFIAVMQACFNELHLKWDRANQRRKGIRFGLAVDTSMRNLTDLRFADDVVLFAQQRSDIAKMLEHLSQVSQKYSLKIHYGTTKVMTWAACAAGCTSVNVCGHSVGIIPEDARLPRHRT